MGDREDHNYCTQKFIDLANELHDEGQSVALVSAALMAACSVYTTYSAAGNAGALEPSGVDKVVSMFRRNLEHIQKIKRNELDGDGA